MRITRRRQSEDLDEAVVAGADERTEEVAEKLLEAEGMLGLGEWVQRVGRGDMIGGAAGRSSLNYKKSMNIYTHSCFMGGH